MSTTPLSTDCDRLAATAHACESAWTIWQTLRQSAQQTVAAEDARHAHLSADIAAVDGVRQRLHDGGAGSDDVSVLQVLLAVRRDQLRACARHLAAHRQAVADAHHTALHLDQLRAEARQLLTAWQQGPTDAGLGRRVESAFRDLRRRLLEAVGDILAPLDDDNHDLDGAEEFGRARAPSLSLSTMSDAESVAVPRLGRARACTDYVAQSAEELSFRRGDPLFIVKWADRQRMLYAEDRHGDVGQVHASRLDGLEAYDVLGDDQHHHRRRQPSSNSSLSPVAELSSPPTPPPNSPPPCAPLHQLPISISTSSSKQPTNSPTRSPPKQPRQLVNSPARPVQRALSPHHIVPRPMHTVVGSAIIVSALAAKARQRSEANASMARQQQHSTDSAKQPPPASSRRHRPTVNVSVSVHSTLDGSRKEPPALPQSPRPRHVNLHSPTTPVKTMASVTATSTPLSSRHQADRKPRKSPRLEYLASPM